MMKNSLKAGAMLSYVLIIFNTFYGLFFTPFLINSLGDGEYGVYKIISSLIGSMTVLNLGIGSTVLRYIAKFKAENDTKNIKNFSAMGFIQAAVLSAVMIIVCAVVYFNIETIYSESLTARELNRAKELFVLFTVILVLNTFEKVINGVIAGFGRYVFANSIRLFHIASKCFFAYLLLQKTSNSVVLLVIEIVVLVSIMVVQMLYICVSLKSAPRLYNWDKRLFGESFKYTVLMFIQSLAVQINSNLDNTVIGSVVGSVAVAIYSVGLQIYNMYEQFAMSLSDMMLPVVSQQIADGADNKQLEDTVIKVGRLEFILLGGALAGFGIIGREFVRLWLGNDYMLAWWVAMILMVPTTIPLVQNVSLSILRARNKMAFRTVAVCIMALFNLVFTIVGVKLFGAMAACIGTAISLIAANIIAMNIYYVKVIHLNVFRIFKNVFARSWLCCLVASGVLFVSNIFIKESNWTLWLCKVGIFVVVYGILLILYGFNEAEKKMVFGRLLNKFKRKSTK